MAAPAALGPVPVGIDIELHLCHSGAAWGSWGEPCHFPSLLLRTRWQQRLGMPWLPKGFGRGTKLGGAQRHLPSLSREMPLHMDFWQPGTPYTQAAPPFPTPCNATSGSSSSSALPSPAGRELPLPCSCLPLPAAAPGSPQARPGPVEAGRSGCLDLPPCPTELHACNATSCCGLLVGRQELV